MEPSLLLYQESLAVEDSIQHALQLIQTYTEDPADWRDRPEQIYQSLDDARNRITTAWKNLQSATTAAVQDGGTMIGPGEATNNTSSTSSSHTAEQQEIRVAFVDMITDAFADVLLDQQLRQDTNIDPEEAKAINVEALVDCLQSGLDMMNITSVSDLAWFEEDEIDGEEDGGSEVLTPHEQRRCAMGFPVEEAAA